MAAEPYQEPKAGIHAALSFLRSIWGHRRKAFAVLAVILALFVVYGAWSLLSGSRKIAGEDIIRAAPIQTAQPASPTTPSPRDPAPAGGVHGTLTPVRRPEVEGVLFLQAYIHVLDYELRERRFGWRPNSLLSGKLRLTDNVRNAQLGVLETVRVVGRVLKEKITRFGDADAFNPQIEKATNLFMISAGQFWFPAADEEYRKGIAELERYLKDLNAGRVRFYARSDTFEHLVHACKELVGNCHHNLIKQTESDGTLVSTWRADDYFYYAQGVASAMGSILEAGLVDFREELVLIKGLKLMEEVVHALDRAAGMNPWIVLNGNLNGFLANHRANMAVPMGEALFKLNNVLRYGGGGV